MWMNGIRVGSWIQMARGANSFQYDAGWMESGHARVLSLSLPFAPGNEPHRGDVVVNYFDNLLPDAEVIRRRLRSRFRTRSAGTFDLLAAIGRDCVGAVQLLPDGETPVGHDRIEGVPLDDAGVEQAIVTALSGDRVLGHGEEDGFRISIAGAQEKTALLFHEGRWCRPLGATPTTHILKLPLGLVGAMQADMKDSVENEWLCSRILKEFGLPAAECEIGRFGERRVLIVQRFDRARMPSGWIARLPQEDFCQALGLPSARKYESDGGPGMRDVLRILESSSRAAEDKRRFVNAQILYWMLAATDGHAKNFSIFHESHNTYRLTPFYDILSAWPIIGPGRGQLAIQKAKLAMAVRGKNPHWKLREIQPRHWTTLTRLAGMGPADALLAELASQVPSVIAAVSAALPPAFPAHVSDAIFNGLQESAARLGEG